MENDKPGIRKGCVPFQDEDKSRAMREEDAFMEAHGGPGARFVYCLVDWVADCFDLPRRLVETRRRKSCQKSPVKCCPLPD